MSLDSLPGNQSVIQALRNGAAPENARSGYVVDGYEVHTHPDLTERLQYLIKYAPGAKFKYLFGTPTLSTPAGVIFATACGTSTLCLRLPETAKWGREYPEYGSEWRQGFAWIMGRPNAQEDEKRLSEVVQVAYSTANSEQ